MQLGLKNASIPEPGFPRQLSGISDEFQISATLGQGGSATVYQARWKGQNVALKVLSDHLADNPSEVSRFNAEARLLGKIDHPSVVRLFDYGLLDDGRPYLVMEQLHGQTLAERLDTNPLSLGEACEVFNAVCSALTAMHRRGLLHRDIKPENIFLVAGSQKAILLDFGIAKPCSAPDSTVTLSGGVRGTPAYMAPERFFGARASVRTEVYELGVLLYLMLVRRLPWDDTEDAAARLCPVRPSDIGISLPGTIEDCLCKALSTRAENRPESVECFLESVTKSMTTANFALGRMTKEFDISKKNSAAKPLAKHLFKTVRFWSWTKRRSLLSRVALGLMAICFVFSIPADGSSSRPTQEPKNSKVQSATASLSAKATSQPFVKPPVDKLVAAEDSALKEQLWSHHPVDTSVLVWYSHERFKQSPYFDSLFSSVKFDEGKAALSIVHLMCGINLNEQLKWVSIGLAQEDQSLFDASLSGDWTRAQLEKCIQDFSSQSDQKISIERNGPLTTIELANNTFRLAWLDDKTVFFSSRPEADAAWLKQRLEGKNSMRRHNLMGDFDNQLESGSFIWVASQSTDWFDDIFPESFLKPIQALTVSVNSAKNIYFSGQLKTASFEQARQATQQLTSQTQALVNSSFSKVSFEDVSFEQQDDSILWQIVLTRMSGTLLVKELSASLSSMKI
jgi:eukaryotic-like serine/threonine-protein kinase